MDSPTRIGQKIGTYTILREIGRGGMGVVYKAEDESLGRIVALKILSDDLAHNDEFVQRFQREAKSAASLEHKNIVQIYAMGHDTELGVHYIAMEYARGWPLDVMIKHRKRLSLRRALLVTRQVAAALAEAHRNNIIHRDIKPNNILVKKDGSVKVLDFGLAKTLDGSADLTADHMQLGTPAYMSPDQYLGGGITLKGDIYSLGVVLYEMLTGEKPYLADTPMGMMRKIANDPFPDVRLKNAGVPESVARLIASMTAKSPDDRPDAAKLYLALRKKPEHEQDDTTPVDEAGGPRGDDAPTPVRGAEHLPTFNSGGLTPDRYVTGADGDIVMDFDYSFKTPHAAAVAVTAQPAAEGEVARRPYGLYLTWAALFMTALGVAAALTMGRGENARAANVSLDEALVDEGAAPTAPAEPNVVAEHAIYVGPSSAIDLIDLAIRKATANRDDARASGRPVEGDGVAFYALELPLMDKIDMGLGDVVERADGRPIHGYDSMLDALSRARERVVRGAAANVEFLVAKAHGGDYWLVTYRFEDSPATE